MRMVEVGRGGAESARSNTEAQRHGELLIRKLHTGSGAFNVFVDDAVYTFHQGFLVEIDK